MFEAFETYKTEFGSKPENAEKVLQGMNWIAEYREDEGEEDEAMDQYRAILKAFKERSLKPGTDSAYYAAKAQFQLAEKKYQKWKKIKIDGDLSEQKKLLDKKIKEQKKVSKAFKKVWDYKNLEYTLASSFRVGSLFQGFAESLYQVPIPFDPGSEQYRMYRTQLEDIAIPLEDKAIERYEQTIKKAREEKIVNEWTKKTLNELNKYRPNEYPLYKESRMASESKLGTGYPLLTQAPETEEGSTNLEETSAGGAGDQNSEDAEESNDDSTQETGDGEQSDEETQS
jgi:rubrerythrin